MIHRIIPFLLIILCGCNLRPQLAAPGANEAAPFLPATLAPTTTPAPVLPTIQARPTPTVPCTDRLIFRGDLTIPDGTQVAPDSTLDKRWEVENSGTCSWDERYHLRLTGGPDMGAKPVQPLFPARSGSKATIRLMMTAPTKPGIYRSAWQAYNPSDEPFGDPFFIEIVVK